MFAVGMKKELQPFCYQHLTEMIHLNEMMLYENDLLKAKTGTAYVCSELNCPVNYHTLDGYFIPSNEGDRIEQSTTHVGEMKTEASQKPVPVRHASSSVYAQALTPAKRAAHLRVVEMIRPKLEWKLFPSVPTLNRSASASD